VSRLAKVAGKLIRLGEPLLFLLIRFGIDLRGTVDTMRGARLPFLLPAPALCPCLIGLK
jgi:hypothetical protein